MSSDEDIVVRLRGVQSPTGIYPSLLAGAADEIEALRQGILGAKEELLERDAEIESLRRAVKAMAREIEELKKEVAGRDDLEMREMKMFGL